MPVKGLWPSWFRASTLFLPSTPTKNLNGAQLSETYIQMMSPLCNNCIFAIGKQQWQCLSVQLEGGAHCALDIQCTHVLPVLLEQRDQEVDTQGDIGSKHVVRHLDMANGNRDTQHLVEGKGRWWGEARRGERHRVFHNQYGNFRDCNNQVNKHHHSSWQGLFLPVTEAVSPPGPTRLTKGGYGNNYKIFFKNCHRSLHKKLQTQSDGSIFSHDITSLFILHIIKFMANIMTTLHQQTAGRLLDL